MCLSPSAFSGLVAFAQPAHLTHLTISLAFTKTPVCQPRTRARRGGFFLRDIWRAPTISPALMLLRVALFFRLEAMTLLLLHSGDIFRVAAGACGLQVPSNFNSSLILPASKVKHGSQTLPSRTSVLLHLSSVPEHMGIILKPWISPLCFRESVIENTINGCTRERLMLSEASWMSWQWKSQLNRERLQTELSDHVFASLRSCHLVAYALIYWSKTS